MKTTMIWVWALILGLPLALSADDIYTWKDKDGVQQFSNDPPPEHIKDYKIIRSAPDDSPGDAPSNRRRSSYEAMVDRARREAEAARQARKKEAAEIAAEKERIAEEKEHARIMAERKRLKAQIEEIKKRAVDRRFTNGMKQAQIDALQKELEALEKETDTSDDKKDAAGE